MLHLCLLLVFLFFFVCSPPTVTLLSPADRTSVDPAIQSSVFVTVNATDNFGVAHVDFVVNGVVLVSDTGVAPYLAEIPTSLFGQAAELRVLIIAYDTSDLNNTVTLTLVKVTDNRCACAVIVIGIIILVFNAVVCIRVITVVDCCDVIVYHYWLSCLFWCYYEVS